MLFLIARFFSVSFHYIFAIHVITVFISWLKFIPNFIKTNFSLYVNHFEIILYIFLNCCCRFYHCIKQIEILISENSSAHHCHCHCHNFHYYCCCLNSFDAFVNCLFFVCYCCFLCLNIRYYFYFCCHQYFRFYCSLESW